MQHGEYFLKMTRYSPIFNPVLRGIFNNYLRICIMNEEQECILRLWHFISQLSVLMHERESEIFMEMVYTIDLNANNNNNKNNCDVKCLRFFCK